MAFVHKSLLLLLTILCRSDCTAIGDNVGEGYEEIPLLYEMPNKPWIEENGDFETSYQKEYLKSIEEPGKYWTNIAKQFKWQNEELLTTDNHNDLFNFNFDKKKGPIFVEWFKNMKTNLAYNALDFQIIDKGLGNKIALYYERNEVDEIGGYKSEYTYSYLRDEVKEKFVFVYLVCLYTWIILEKYILLYIKL